MNKGVHHLGRDAFRFCHRVVIALPDRGMLRQPAIPASANPPSGGSGLYIQGFPPLLLRISSTRLKGV